MDADQITLIMLGVTNFVAVLLSVIHFNVLLSRLRADMDACFDRMDRHFDNLLRRFDDLASR